MRQTHSWLRGLLLMAVLLALAGCTSAPDKDASVREFHLTTRQFQYEPAEVRVKKGDRVRLNVTSTDVTHGFGIAEYRINRQTPPGQTVTIEFIADKPGRFVIYCTVFCGTGHAEHKAVLIVEE
jgi:heme/copper-type cytochrome/quinol oxidase subunit 2